jgi:hypothetical protein
VRRRLWALVFIGVGVGGLLAVALLWEKMASGPTACALVRLSKAPPHILPDSAPTGRREDDFETFRQNQVALVKSRMVLTNVLHDPKVIPILPTPPSPSYATQILNWLFNSKPQDPVEWLEEHVQVDFELSPEIMRISVTGKNPDESIAIVTAVRDAYLNRVRDSERLKLDNLISMRNKYYLTLREQRSDLTRSTEQHSSTPAPTLQRELVAQELLDCKRELLRVRLARAAANAGKDKEAPADDRSLAVQEELLRNEETALLAKADRLEKEKRNDLNAGIQPEIENLEGMIKQLNADIERLRRERDTAPRIDAFDEVYLRKAK